MSTALFAAACGFIVANIYYAQPLIAPIAAELGLPPRSAGLIVTLTQLGYGAGLLLIVSGPAVVLAWFKLRSRNLGPILDANGWAINARAHINIPFGTSLTQLAQLPANAERALTDPYADKRWPWGLYAGILALLVLAAFVWLVRSTAQ